MAGKFHGTIGFVKTEETVSGSGNYKAVATERDYYGENIRNTRRWQSGESLNDNLVLDNQFSIVADAFALDLVNLQAMKYVKWNGVSWKIMNVDIQRPRLILTVGGVYNG